MKRLFSKAQRKALHDRAGGRCEGTGPQVGLPEGVRCPNPLGSNWIADHIEPYAAGGETTIENGQALCVKCSIAKTSKFDIPRVAKNTRVREKATGIRKPKRKMTHPHLKRKPDGTVVPR